VIFNKSKCKYTYGPKTFHILFIAILVVIIWAGSVFEMHEHGFRGGVYSKSLSSAALIYLAWLFIVSRTKQELKIDEIGITVPNTWLPGIVKHRFTWHDIADISYDHKNRLETLCIRLKNNKKHHIYTKALNAYYHNRVVRNPVEELMAYIINVIEARNTST